MTTDPYGDLGVDPDASPEEIKAAYHAKARQHHPDKGADRDAFEAAQRAYLVLADPVARHNHDTGKTRDTSASAAEKRLTVALSQLLGSLLDGELDLDHTDMKAHMRAALAKVDADLNREFAKLPKLTRRLDTVARRLRRRAGKPAGRVEADSLILAAVIKQHRQAIEARRQELVQVRETQERVKAVINAHDYQFDVVMQLSGWGLQTMSSINRPF